MTSKPEGPDELADEVRKTALDYAVRYHGQTASSATAPAAAKSIIVTAQTFEAFLRDGGLFDIAQLAAQRKQEDSA